MISGAVIAVCAGDMHETQTRRVSTVGKRLDVAGGHNRRGAEAEQGDDGALHCGASRPVRAAARSIAVTSSRSPARSAPPRALKHGSAASGCPM
jgi:hypothetical protein